MSDKTGLGMVMLKTLETFSPVPYTADNEGMESTENGKWVKLSDVRALCAAFMVVLGYRDRT